MADFFLDYASRVDLELDHDEIVTCTDAAQLASWFTQIAEKTEELHSFCAGYSEAGHDDPEWRRRAGGKLGYLKLASRWVEQRMLVLGLAPPYRQADPRIREIRSQARQIEKLKGELAALRPPASPTPAPPGESPNVA